jgi:hypothetical protein
LPHCSLPQKTNSSDGAGCGERIPVYDIVGGYLPPEHPSYGRDVTQEALHWQRDPLYGCSYWQKAIEGHMRACNDVR